MATLTAPAAARAIAKERGLVRPPKPETLAPTAPKDSEKQIRIAQHREQKRIAREHLCPLLREVFPEQLVAGFSWRPPIVKTAVRSRCLAFPAFGLPLGARINPLPGFNLINPRATAAMLAAVGFGALIFIPQLKYPANPLSVGEPETIAARIALYFIFIMIGLSVIAAVAATSTAR